jgi:hypothetical protein
MQAAVRAVQGGYDTDALDIAISAYLKAAGGEPVAWLAEGYGYRRVFLEREAAEKLARGGELIPLYTAPQAPAVRVTGLVWRKYRNGDAEAVSPFGEIYTAYMSGHYRITKNGKAGKFIRGGDNVEAAKAAAFADYEQRIRSALEAEAGGGKATYEPCGGCGNTDPDKRCLGCLHPFVATTTDERAVEALRAVQEYSQSQIDCTMADGGVGTGFRRAMLDVIAFCDRAALAQGESRNG